MMLNHEEGKALLKALIAALLQHHAVHLVVLVATVNQIVVACFGCTLLGLEVAQTQVDAYAEAAYRHVGGDGVAEVSTMGDVLYLQVLTEGVDGHYAHAHAILLEERFSETEDMHVDTRSLTLQGEGAAVTHVGTAQT